MKMPAKFLLGEILRAAFLYLISVILSQNQASKLTAVAAIRITKLLIIITHHITAKEQNIKEEIKMCEAVLQSLEVPLSFPSTSSLTCH